MLAETAELAVVLKLKDELTGGLTAAQGKLSTLEATAGRTATGSLTRLQTVTNGVGTALGHAKSQLSGLIGGFGLLAGGAAAFGVFGALEQGVKRVEDMGLAVEKLTGVTGLSVHSASQLVAVFEKFGVDAGAATTSAAFAEKTIGKLAATMTGSGAAAVSKLTALDKQYGIQLVDSKGKAVDYATELGIVADYYTSNAAASDKAALAAQLFGRGYVSLIPILKLGSAGIAEAAAEADKLGITLKTAQDVQNVKVFIAAQRDAQEAIGGLEVQLGLLVMPDLSKGLVALRDFVVNNRSAITGGFRDLLTVAEQIGGAFTNVVIPAIQAIGGVWNSLPGPIKELLIGGFLANKAVKWTFGIDVAGLAGGALKGAIEGLFKNATTAAMSVEAGVVNVVGATGIPGVPGVPGAPAVPVEATAAEGGLSGFLKSLLHFGGGGAAVAITIPKWDAISAKILAAQGGWTPKSSPTSSGGTGGSSFGDQYPKELRAVVDTGSAGVMARAIANGLKPTASGITATLAKDNTMQAIEAAVNRTTSAVEGISVAGGTGGNVGQDQYPPVVIHNHVTVSARQNETAATNANAYGPSPSRAGAQGAPVRT